MSDENNDQPSQPEEHEGVDHPGDPQCTCGLPFCASRGAALITEFLSNFHPRVVIDELDDKAAYIHNQDVATAILALVNVNMAANIEAGTVPSTLNIAYQAMGGLAMGLSSVLADPARWIILDNADLPDTVPTDWMKE